MRKEVLQSIFMSENVQYDVVYDPEGSTRENRPNGRRLREYKWA